SGEPQEVDLYNGRIDVAKVRELARAVFSPRSVTECFVSGPGSMIDEVSGVLRELGIDSDRIHTEHFTVAAEPSTAVAREKVVEVPGGGAPSVSTDDTAEVVVHMDGRRRAFTMRMN